MTDDADNIRLLPLGPLELVVVSALHANCFDDGWSEGAMAQIMAMPGCFGALAHAGHQPVGFIIVLAVGSEAEILTLGVLPEFRRRGIALRLLAWAVERLSGVDCRRLLLEVAEDNAGARALYGKLGFAEIGRRPSYYRRSAGRAAAIVLARTLNGEKR